MYLHRSQRTSGAGAGRYFARSLERPQIFIRPRGSLLQKSHEVLGAARGLGLPTEFDAERSEHFRERGSVDRAPSRRRGGRWAEGTPDPAKACLATLSRPVPGRGARAASAGGRESV